MKVRLLITDEEDTIPVEKTFDEFIEDERRYMQEKVKFLQTIKKIKKGHEWYDIKYNLQEKIVAEICYSYTLNICYLLAQTVLVDQKDKHADASDRAVAAFSSLFLDEATVKTYWKEILADIPEMELSDNSKTERQLHNLLRRYAPANPKEMIDGARQLIEETLLPKKDKAMQNMN
ncbi:MAG: hypothetical protein JWM56_92 [Candidatus Peribacteria bacterium]|nr:hypothetical protein [Candidatus Peribacteria bacterium]